MVHIELSRMYHNHETMEPKGTVFEITDFVQSSSAYERISACHIEFAYTTFRNRLVILVVTTSDT
jgi:hypothetical protein